jgi:hypothetical protein
VRIRRGRERKKESKREVEKKVSSKGIEEEEKG